MEKTLQVERYLTIMNIIKKKKTVKIDELSAILKVSNNTVRRDLTNLEKQGLLQRSHGGAVFTDGDELTKPYDIRLHEGFTEKEIIGRCAARYVEPGSTIIIDAGTTTEQLARHLVDMKDLTVLTNSIKIAETLAANPNIVVIISGGIYQQSYQHLVGLPAEQFFAHIHVDKVFLSSRAISIEQGLTSSNLSVIPVKRKMIEAAKEAIVLVDSTKFEKVGISQVVPLNDIRKIITDSKISKEIALRLKEMGIEVIIADERSEAL